VATLGRETINGMVDTICPAFARRGHRVDARWEPRATRQAGGSAGVGGDVAYLDRVGELMAATYQPGRHIAQVTTAGRERAPEPEDTGSPERL